MKILMVQTSHDQLGDTGRQTGFWLDEFATPFFIFRDADLRLTLASPKGRHGISKYSYYGRSSPIMSRSATSSIAYSINPDKTLRSSFSNPSLDEGVAFRAHVNREMERLFLRSIDREVSRRIVLGLCHEAQHQKLALIDIRHASYSNPPRPAYRSGVMPNDHDHPIPKFRRLNFEGELTNIDYSRTHTTFLKFALTTKLPVIVSICNPSKLQTATLLVVSIWSLCRMMNNPEP